MAASYFIDRLFLLFAGNRIQDCYPACYFTLSQDDLDIIIVFLRRDEREEFGLMTTFILINDCQRCTVQRNTHRPGIICNRFSSDIFYSTIYDIAFLETQQVTNTTADITLKYEDVSLNRQTRSRRQFLLRPVSFRNRFNME